MASNENLWTSNLEGGKQLVGRLPPKFAVVIPLLVEYVMVECMSVYLCICTYWESDDLIYTCSVIQNVDPQPLLSTTEFWNLKLI